MVRKLKVYKPFVFSDLDDQGFNFVVASLCFDRGILRECHTPVAPMICPRTNQHNPI
jgi:hypothetical protein